MTLGELSCVLNVQPKWILNVSAALDGSLQYTLPEARRLAVARALQESLGMPIARAYGLAADVLRRYDRDRSSVPLFGESGPIVVMVDVYRILAVVNTGLSRLRCSYAPRSQGRPASTNEDPMRAAADHGLDLTLLASNLRRGPTERLRQLDGMVDFRKRVTRGREVDRWSPRARATTR